MTAHGREPTFNTVKMPQNNAISPTRDRARRFAVVVVGRAGYRGR